MRAQEEESETTLDIAAATLLNTKRNASSYLSALTNKGATLASKDKGDEIIKSVTPSSQHQEDTVLFGY